jgi:hypothetical protein
MKTQKYDEIKRGSKIKLLKNTEFLTFGNEKVILQKGYYFIIGFWANVCGLSKDKDDIKKQNCQFDILAFALTNFENIIK